MAHRFSAHIGRSYAKASSSGVTRSLTSSLRPRAFQHSRRKSIRSQSVIGFAFTSFGRLFGSMNSNSEFQVDPTEKWWNENTVAIVTGANKGIGKAAAQILAENGLTTIVAARDEARGQEAVKEIRGITGEKNVFFEQLDISDKHSVTEFAKSIKKNYKGVSILINNAGMAYKGNAFGAEEAQITLDTNLIGTINVCDAILPLMEKPARIVNVCSRAGKQGQIRNSTLLKRFQNASSADDVRQLAQEFVSAIKDDSYSDKGWSSSMYGISKLCEATYTRVLGEQLQGQDIDVNACCPGYVKTDMSSHRGHKTVAEGADTPVWLALLAPKGTSAKFFSERKQDNF